MELNEAKKLVKGDLIEYRSGYSGKVYQGIFDSLHPHGRVFAYWGSKKYTTHVNYNLVRRIASPEQQLLNEYRID